MSGRGIAPRWHDAARLRPDPGAGGRRCRPALAFRQDPGLGRFRETRHPGMISRGHAFDAADGSRLGPLTPAHMHLGVIDAERLYLDDDMYGPRLRLADLFDDQAIGATKFSRTIARIRSLLGSLYNFR